MFFLLLADAKPQVPPVGKEMELETAARILDMLPKAVQRLPEDYPKLHAEAYRATAEILEALGDNANAAECYECALQKDPDIAVRRRLDALKKVIGAGEA